MQYETHLNNTSVINRLTLNRLRLTQTLLSAIENQNNRFIQNNLSGAYSGPLQTAVMELCLRKEFFAENLFLQKASIIGI